MPQLQAIFFYIMEETISPKWRLLIDLAFVFMGGAVMYKELKRELIPDDHKGLLCMVNGILGFIVSEGFVFGIAKYIYMGFVYDEVQSPVMGVVLFGSITTVVAFVLVDNILPAVIKKVYQVIMSEF